MRENEFSANTCFQISYGTIAHVSLGFCCCCFCVENWVAVGVACKVLSGVPGLVGFPLALFCVCACVCAVVYVGKTGCPMLAAGCFGVLHHHDG